MKAIVLTWQFESLLIFSTDSTSILSTAAASSFFTPLSQMPSSVAFMSPTETLPMPTPCHCNYYRMIDYQRADVDFALHVCNSDYLSTFAVSG